MLHHRDTEGTERIGMGNGIGIRYSVFGVRVFGSELNHKGAKDTKKTFRAFLTG